MSVYLVSRFHGIKTRLLPYNTFDAISALKSLRDLANFLSPTEYARYLEKTENLTPESFYEAYAKVFAERLNLIHMIPLPRNLKRFLTSYLAKYDYENVVKVLRGIKAERDPSEIKRTIIPISFSRTNLDELLQLRSVDKAIEILIRDGYKIKPKGVELFKKYDSLLPIEADLRKAYFRDLIERSSLIDKPTRAKIESVVRTMAEVENVFASVASILYGYSQELVQYTLIPVTKSISRDVFERVTATKNPREIQQVFSKYSKIVDFLLEKKEFEAKLEANKLILKLLRKVGIQGSMSLAYVVYVVESMEFEFRNLSYLTYLTYYGFSEADKRAILI